MNYFVMIVNDACEGMVGLLKVQADNHVEAQIKALANYNQVDYDEIDLDCMGDIQMYVVEENDLEDCTPAQGFTD